MWRYWRWHLRGRVDISMVSERPKNGQGEHQSIKQKKPFRECRLALDLVKKVRIWTNINHNTDSNTGFSRFNFSISRLSPENVVLMAPVHRIMITYQFKQDIVQICPYFKNSIVPLNLWTTCYLAPILSRSTVVLVLISPFSPAVCREDNSADHARPVPEDPGEGGRQRGGRTVTHTHTLPAGKYWYRNFKVVVWIRIFKCNLRIQYVRCRSGPFFNFKL